MRMREVACFQNKKCCRQQLSGVDMLMHDIHFSQAFSCVTLSTIKIPLTSKLRTCFLSNIAFPSDKAAFCLQVIFHKTRQFYNGLKVDEQVFLQLPD